MFVVLAKWFGLKTKSAPNSRKPWERKAHLSVQQLEDRLLMAANLLGPVAAVAPASQSKTLTPAVVQILDTHQLAVVQSHAEVAAVMPAVAAVVKPATSATVTATVKSTTATPATNHNLAPITRVTLTAPKGKVVAHVTISPSKGGKPPARAAVVAATVSGQADLRSRVGPVTAIVDSLSQTRTPAQSGPDLGGFNQGLVTSQESMLSDQNGVLDGGGNWLVTWGGWVAACYAGATATGPAGAILGWGVCAAGAAVIAGNVGASDNTGFSGGVDATSSVVPVGGPTSQDPPGGNGYVPAQNTDSSSGQNPSPNPDPNSDQNACTAPDQTPPNQTEPDADNRYPPPPLDDGNCVNPDADPTGGSWRPVGGHVTHDDKVTLDRQLAAHRGGVADPAPDGPLGNGPLTPEEILAAKKAVGSRTGSNDGGHNQEAQSPPTADDARHVAQVKSGGVSDPLRDGHQAATTTAVNAAVNVSAQAHR
jgi:hypothetical protein